MEMLKKLGNRWVTAVVCDTCYQICPEGDYMGTPDNAMCIDCWNRIHKRKQPAETPNSTD